MSDELIFDDVTLRSEPVRIAGERYFLVEASEEAACKFKGAVLKSTRMSDGKLAGAGEGLPEADSLLVSLCLYRAGADGSLVLKNGMPDPAYRVALHLIREWPARITSRLVRRVKVISEMEALETVEDLQKRIAADTERLAILKAGGAEKNGHDSTTATSEQPATLASS